jgi:tetratricopeptide (TPR) repeat protein
LFNLFKSEKIDNSTSVSIENLFNARLYQPYVQKEQNKTIRDFFWNCNDIQESLNRIIEECEKYDTPESRYYKALSLAWSRIEYNNRAIYELENYLNKEPYLINGKTEDILRPSTLGYLGKAYEKNKNYEKSLEIYMEQSKLDLGQVPLINITEIYRKKNDLDSAITLLKKSLDNNNNCIDKRVIERYLDDYIIKKKKGYIFVSKKKKNDGV